MNRYNPDIHRRRSIRLKGYDYSQAGGYFLTICSYNRECLFGEIANGEMVLNPCGEILRSEWLKSADIRAELELGEYVIMPNHFHAIVVITSESCDGQCRGDRSVAPNRSVAPKPGPQSKSIGSMVAGFKSAVTAHINQIRGTPGTPVWQRNYYEHIIRNEADYVRIAEYVADNPRHWAEDSLHPANVGATGRSPLHAARGGQDE